MSPSAIAGILNATTPMMTLLIISLAFREQKPTLNQNLGIVLGFAGVALVGLGGGEISFTSPWGIALLLLATLCYGIAMPYAKRFVSPLPYSPYVLATAQVSASALLAALPALLVGVTHAPVSASALWGILALGILGTGFAYVWNYRNIELAGSVIASSVTYVTPVIAVVLGFLVLGERLTLLQAAGGVLVLVSALVVQKRLKLWPAAA